MLEESVKDEATTEARGESETVNVAECTFHQIRKRFEEKSKPIPQKVVNDSSEDIIKTDFQKLYPLFKRYYTKRQYNAMEMCFDSADRNHDGFLEAKELKQLLVDHNLPTNLCDADVIVSIGDKNQDGKLCPKEFLDLCTSTAKNLREEQFKAGGLFLSDQQFVKAILKEMRNLANPRHRNVKGTRQYFENIGSGNVEENVDNSPTKRTALSRYLRTINQGKQSTDN